METYEIIFIIGCVVSFICGLLTPHFTHGRKPTSTDLLFAALCACGSWIYAIMFIVSIATRPLFNHFVEDDDDCNIIENEDDRIDGMDIYQIVAALIKNPNDEFVNSHYNITYFPQKPCDVEETVIENATIVSHKGWDYINPKICFKSFVRICPITGWLDDDEPVKKIPYNTNIIIPTERLPIDDFKMVYENVEILNSLDIIRIQEKVFINHTIPLFKCNYTDTISFYVNGYAYTLFNIFIKELADSTITLEYDYIHQKYADDV